MRAIESDHCHSSYITAVFLVTCGGDPKGPQQASKHSEMQALETSMVSLAKFVPLQ